MKKNKTPPWHQAFLIALVVLLALLLIFSRGYRAARRATIPVDSPEQQGMPVSPDTIQEPVKTISLDTLKQERIYDTPNDLESMTTSSIFSIPEITSNMLLGHIDPPSDHDFILIDESHASRSGMYMRIAAYDAFLEMRKAAMKDGITLTVLSAARTFDHQKRIWENKWNGHQVLHGNVLATDIPDPVERAREILRFSAMPGTSRHHWGTDIDLNSLQNAYFESGEGKKVYQWLLANAGDYGYCQPYTARDKDRTGGYEEEKWHWSYFPIASGFLRAYPKLVSYDDIKGFDGAGTARRLMVIERYVLAISENCY